MDLLAKYGGLLTGILYVLAWADAMIPPPAEGSRWTKPRGALHWIAANKGYALNAIEKAEAK